MTQTKLYPIRPDRSFFDRAITILEHQPKVPMSSGSIEDGRILLCAGAALIAAAIEIVHSDCDREIFEREIVSADGEHRFYRTIDELGWCGWIVAGAVRPNDACDDTVRKSCMLERLKELAEQVCGTPLAKRAA